MAATKNKAFVTWQQAAGQEFLALAQKVAQNYAQTLSDLMHRETFTDEDFTEVIAFAAVSYSDTKALAKSTNLDPGKVASWVKGNDLPVHVQRQAILQLCVASALSQLNENGPRHLLQYAVPSLASGTAWALEAVKATPDLDTLLQDVPGWDQISVRSQNGLRNWSILCLGDLVVFTEGKLLRVPNFGRKSLDEVKYWLSRFNLQLLASDSDVPDDLKKFLSRQKLRERGTERIPDPSEVVSSVRDIFTTLHLNNVKTFGMLATLTIAELEAMFKGEEAWIAAIKTALAERDLEIGMEKLPEL